MTVEELEARALRLSAQGRARLAEHLLLSLDEKEDPACEKAWLDEADKRYAAYKQGKLKGRSAAQAFRAARARLR